MEQVLDSTPANITIDSATSGSKQKRESTSSWMRNPNFASRRSKRLDPSLKSFEEEKSEAYKNAENKPELKRLAFGYWKKLEDDTEMVNNPNNPKSTKANHLTDAVRSSSSDPKKDGNFTFVWRRSKRLNPHLDFVEEKETLAIKKAKNTSELKGLEFGYWKKLEDEVVPKKYREPKWPAHLPPPRYPMFGKNGICGDNMRFMAEIIPKDTPEAIAGTAQWIADSDDPEKQREWYFMFRKVTWDLLGLTGNDDDALDV